jgi:hypothetical protein
MTVNASEGIAADGVAQVAFLDAAVKSSPTLRSSTTPTDSMLLRLAQR